MLMSPTYLMGWAHRRVCDALDWFLAEVDAGNSPRLMIAMPPRHGKSELASRLFPAFALGRRPDLSVIAASYGASLALRMSRDVQRIMDSEAYRSVFPKTRLARRTGPAARRAADMFEIEGRRGSYRAAGVGGSVTGMGGDVLIVDDAFKDRASADSAATRRRVWEWYGSTLYTRLSPGGGVLLVNTRWREDDLAGRLMAAEAAGRGDAWRKLVFPAVAETDEPWRRAGEALHPERFPLERLRRIRAAVGEREWAALYQQRPAPEGGAVFRSTWFRRWRPEDLPPRWDAMTISWDMSFVGAADADFAVGQVWARSGGNFYLLDQVRRRMGFSETAAALTALCRKWPDAFRVLVEDKANGPAVIDALKSRIPGLTPVRPDGGKVARANAVTPLLESGNVWFPPDELAPWIGDMLAELTAFPDGAHDDQVDAMTQALRDLRRRAPLNIDLAILEGEL